MTMIESLEFWGQYWGTHAWVEMISNLGQAALASASGALFREGTKEGTEGLKRITGEKKRGQKNSEQPLFLLS